MGNFQKTVVTIASIIVIFAGIIIGGKYILAFVKSRSEEQQATAFWKQLECIRILRYEARAKAGEVAKESVSRVLADANQCRDEVPGIRTRFCDSLLYDLKESQTNQSNNSSVEITPADVKEAALCDQEFRRSSSTGEASPADRS
jgi:hypothetical protein